MALTVTHKFTSAKADSPDVSLIKPSNWNDTHAVSGTSDPGGADTQVQFNDGGVLAGDAGLTYNKTTHQLDAAGSIITAFLLSLSANPASVGVVRLANTDAIAWRNNANSGDLTLASNANNQLKFTGDAVSSAVFQANSPSADATLQATAATGHNAEMRVTQTGIADWHMRNVATSGLLQFANSTFSMLQMRADGTGNGFGNQNTSLNAITLSVMDATPATGATLLGVGTDNNGHTSALTTQLNITPGATQSTTPPLKVGALTFFAAAGAADVGVSRTAANTLGFGNGTQNNISSTLLAGVHSNPSQTTGIDATGLQLGTGRVVGFGPNAGFGSPDVGLSRSSAGTLAIGNGTAGDVSANVFALGFTAGGNMTTSTAGAFRFSTTRSKIMSSADGTLQITNAAGTTGARVTQLTAVTTALTFATLPATPAAGERSFITDSNTAVFNANAAGGGANAVPVIYNGTAWVVG